MSKLNILYGKDLADKILLDLREKIVEGEKLGKIERPGLAAVMVGEDPASFLYIKNKKKACQKVGIDFHSYNLPENANDGDVLEVISFLNNDPTVFGIIAQLPLPDKFDVEKIVSSILAQKDVDGFNKKNLEALNLLSSFPVETKNLSFVIPPTINAIFDLLDMTKEVLMGKKAVIISKGEIFGKHLERILKIRSIDAKILHPDEGNFFSKLSEADIIIIAIGNPGFLKEEMVKEGAIIIDVGTTLVEDELIGDVDLYSCAKKVSYISPVPGGVGPLTVAYLLKNLVDLWEKYR